MRKRKPRVIEGREDPTPTHRALSPDGAEIVGTLEIVHGCSKIFGFTEQTNGSFAYSYEGGTDYWTDDQRTATRRGLTLFVDADGEIWTERELTFEEIK